jgi:hypothetical protein
MVHEDDELAHTSGDGHEWFFSCRVQAGRLRYVPPPSSTPASFIVAKEILDEHITKKSILVGTRSTASRTLK